MKNTFSHIKNILLAILTVLLIATSLGTWYNHSQLVRTQDKLGVVEQRAEKAEKDLGNALKKHDQIAATLKEISKKQNVLSQRQKKAEGDLNNVEETSKVYLATPIPADVSRVLDSIFEESDNDK